MDDENQHPTEPAMATASNKVLVNLGNAGGSTASPALTRSTTAKKAAQAGQAAAKETAKKANKKAAGLEKKIKALAASGVPSKYLSQLERFKVSTYGLK